MQDSITRSNVWRTVKIREHCDCCPCRPFVNIREINGLRIRREQIHDGHSASEPIAYRVYIFSSYQQFESAIARWVRTTRIYLKSDSRNSCEKNRQSFWPPLSPPQISMNNNNFQECASALSQIAPNKLIKSMHLNEFPYFLFLHPHPCSIETFNQFERNQCRLTMSPKGWNACIRWSSVSLSPR